MIEVRGGQRLGNMAYCYRYAEIPIHRRNAKWEVFSDDGVSLWVFLIADVVSVFALRKVLGMFHICIMMLNDISERERGAKRLI